MERQCGSAREHDRSERKLARFSAVFTIGAASWRHKIGGEPGRNAVLEILGCHMISDSSDSRSEQRLRRLLRIFGGICLLAIVPLYMPAAWIHRGHELLGWGAFPAVPIAEYLARSTSALSAFYGGLLVALSFDVRRFAPIIRYQAIAIVVYSISGLVMGRIAGLPWWFLVGDLVGCVGFSTPIWRLAGRVATAKPGENAAGNASP
jgi:hypothetical protein